MSKSIKIDATKRGLPATWETGGGLTSGGSATIIAKADGSKPRAVFVRTRGHLAGGPHALICVHEGFYLVHVSVGRGVRTSATIERITKTSVKDVHGEKFEATAEVEVVNTFSRGEWDRPLEAKFEAAVEAAFRKASIYHCRSAVYIDTSERAPESDEKRKRREAEMAKQDAERARLRAEKAAADAKAKAEAEAASREAKASGLGARLEAAQVRLDALKSSEPNTGYSKLELGESYFVFGWGEKLYTEANVADVERNVAYWEEQAVEKLHKQMARTEFQPQFEALASRAEVLGLTLSYGEEKVNWEGGSYYGGFAYTQEGLDSLKADLTRKEEAKAAKEREEVEAAAKAQAEAEGAAAGLPADVRIWCRMGGTNNRGCGWVVRPDGTFRDADSIDGAPRRVARYGEGDLVWNQILPGELVLRYRRADRYDIAHCEIVHRPEVVTPAQLAAAKQIEEDLEASENAFGLDDRLGELLDRRAAAIKEAMADLPRALWPADGWTLEELGSAHGITLLGGGRVESWIDNRAPFTEYCEGREAQVVYELPAADGTLQVLAYYKWGCWNLNLWWREQADVTPATVVAEAPAEPVDMETALQRLQDKFGHNH